MYRKDIGSISEREEKSKVIEKHFPNRKKNIFHIEDILTDHLKYIKTHNKMFKKRLLKNLLPSISMLHKNDRNTICGRKPTTTKERQSSDVVTFLQRRWHNMD